MGRKPRAHLSPEEKWQIVQESIESGHGFPCCKFSRTPAELVTHKANDIISTQTLRPSIVLCPSPFLVLAQKDGAR